MRGGGQPVRSGPRAARTVAETGRREPVNVMRNRLGLVGRKAGTCEHVGYDIA
jgi:hypothetical protein